MQCVFPIYFGLGLERHLLRVEAASRDNCSRVIDPEICANAPKAVVALVSPLALAFALCGSDGLSVESVSRGLEHTHDRTCHNILALLFWMDIPPC
jgi:Na+(H+)/acetate symporter ActP